MAVWHSMQTPAPAEGARRCGTPVNGRAAVPRQWSESGEGQFQRPLRSPMASDSQIFVSANQHHWPRHGRPRLLHAPIATSPSSRSRVVPISHSRPNRRGSPMLPLRLAAARSPNAGHGSPQRTRQGSLCGLGLVPCGRLSTAEQFQTRWLLCWVWLSTCGCAFCALSSEYMSHFLPPSPSRSLALSWTLLPPDILSLRLSLLPFFLSACRSFT